MTTEQANHRPTHAFRTLQFEQLELVWQWRNSPRIRGFMHNAQAVSWQEHLTWFDSLQADETREFYVLWQNMRPIGVLNFSAMETSSPEWGCYLGEINVWPGSGIILELAALDYIAANHEFTHLLAQVLSFNKAANKLHKVFEYEHVATEPGGERNGMAFEVLHYRYELSLWRQRRQQVLDRLPKQMQLVADNIQFLE